MGKIFNTLKSLNLASETSKEILSNSTRDVENLKVYRDKVSEIIYIDDYFVGNHVYIDGSYRKTKSFNSPEDHEDLMDTKRRLKDFLTFYNDKIICDFGCGKGSFLTKTINNTKKSFGIELQEDYRKELNKKSIDCVDNIDALEDKYLDTCFLFHVLEHLEDPIFHLKSIKSKLKIGGNIIIEVPHARDFLINNLRINEFINFTLWSQHLILHTKESLKTFLSESGYKNIKIIGIQRYSFANHMQWANEKVPGGHRGKIAQFETPQLKEAYQKALDKYDATDTLVAIAEK